MERRFREPEGAVSLPPLPYGPEARARLDAAVLRIVKSGDLKAALSRAEADIAGIKREISRLPPAAN